MKLLPNILIVVGFCVGTVGAAGFAEEIESKAWPLYVGGIVVVAVGAVLKKVAAPARAAGREAGAGGEKQWYLEQIRV